MTAKKIILVALFMFACGGFASAQQFLPPAFQPPAPAPINFASPVFLAPRFRVVRAQLPQATQINFNRPAAPRRPNFTSAQFVVPESRVRSTIGLGRQGGR